MKDFGAMLKQTQAKQAKLQEAQAQMAETTADGSSGGGMVKLTLKGTGELTSMIIDPQLLPPDDAEVLTDQLVAAHAAAKAELMRAAAGPLAGMPGMPF